MILRQARGPLASNNPCLCTLLPVCESCYQVLSRNNGSWLGRMKWIAGLLGVNYICFYGWSLLMLRFQALTSFWFSWCGVNVGLVFLLVIVLVFQLSSSRFSINPACLEPHHVWWIFHLRLSLRIPDERPHGQSWKARGTTRRVGWHIRRHQKISHRRTWQAALLNAHQRRPDWVEENCKCFNKISAELRSVKKTLGSRTFTRSGHSQGDASATNSRAAPEAVSSYPGKRLFL